MRPIVRFAGVTRAYGARLALDDVDLALHPGELTFLVGPSGAGKSTLLKLINREIRPTGGEVWVAGIPAHSLAASHVAELRRKVGVVFQDYKLLPRLTALENVAFALQVGDLRISDEEATDRSQDALEAVGLGDRGGAFPNQLSGGQQQRVAIARALVTNPSLILADEPTGNLDSQVSAEVMQLFQTVNKRGMTVVLVTHEHDIAAYAGRVVRMRDGRVVDDTRQAPGAGHGAGAPAAAGAGNE